MKMKAILAALAIVVALPGVSLAQSRHENLEPACSATGSGMDPRCVGDTEPGTVSDTTSTRQQRALENSGSAVSNVVSTRRAN
ncbi:MAG: hypothetical protein JWM36_3130 [Hyphomicrobiales bacterium]|nr:hypothetical protein [Hyphomicrobiales bacterium]